jgi:hypothetical protein
MATVNKDFKVKNGLIVEGTTATVNNFDVLTKKTEDQNYIIGLIGGSATSKANANAVVLRDATASFAANVITANEFVGDLEGDVTGTVSDISNHDTDDLGEGETSLYFTNARAQAAVAADITAAIDALDTDDIEEGAVNFYFTDQRALDATALAYDLVGSAANALSDAQDYADEARTNAEAYTDTRESAITTAYELYADEVGTNAEAYADAAIANLVGGAPELLDTLNELAAAIGDDANFATTLTNLVATKQDILVEGTNIDIEGNTISVTGLDTDDVAEAGNLYFTNARAQAAVATDITAAIDALDTDDIEEGETNLYFSNTRAKDAAADLLTTATLENITITGSGAGLTITAENGVADSDTDDLVEGATNLYFTNARAQAAVASDITAAIDALDTDDIEEGTSNLYFSNARAIDALEAVVPNFTEIDVNSVATQVAASVEVPTASTVTAYEFDAAQYRSAKFLVKFASGTHTEISEVLLTLDTSDNIAITEYALVGTNGNLGDVSADVNDGNVRLRVATINNSTDVVVMGTLLV